MQRDLDRYDRLVSAGSGKGGRQEDVRRECPTRRSACRDTIEGDRQVSFARQCECDARGRLGLEEKPYPQRERLQAALNAARSVDTATVAAKAREQGLTGDAIGERIQRARTQVVQDLPSR